MSGATKAQPDVEAILAAAEVRPDEGDVDGSVLCGGGLWIRVNEWSRRFAELVAGGPVVGSGWLLVDIHADDNDEPKAVAVTLTGNSSVGTLGLPAPVAPVESVLRECPGSGGYLLNGYESAKVVAYLNAAHAYCCGVELFDAGECGGAV